MVEDNDMSASWMAVSFSTIQPLVFSLTFHAILWAFALLSEAMEKRKRTSNMPDFAIACSTGRPLPSSSSPSYASLSREETQNIGIANQYIAKRLDSYILDTLHFPILCHPLSHHNTKQKPRLAERLLFGFMVAQRAEREDGKGRAKDGKERRI